MLRNQQAMLPLDMDITQNPCSNYLMLKQDILVMSTYFRYMGPMVKRNKLLMLVLTDDGPDQYMPVKRPECALPLSHCGLLKL